MSRFHFSALLLLTALLSVPVLSVGRGATQQEPTLTERVAKLEAEVRALQDRLALQGTTQEEQDKRLKLAEAWMGTLSVAMDQFQKGLDLTVEQGFTYAGANLHARETLVQCLRQVGKALVPKSETDKK
jgi:hypothetical protein